MSKAVGQTETTLPDRVAKAVRKADWRMVLGLLDDFPAERDANPLLGLYHFAALLRLGQPDRGWLVYSPSWRSLDRFHAVMRRDVVAPLARAGEWARAAAAQQRVVDARPASVEDACSLSGLLVRAGDLAAAAVALDHLPAAAQALPAVIRQRLRTAFQAGDVARAAAVVHAAGEAVFADAYSGYLAFLALARNGEPDMARKAARKLDLAALTRPIEVRTLAATLFALGEHDLCLSICTRALNAGARDATLHLYSAQALAAHPDGEEASGAHLREAHALAPGNLDACRLYSDWLMRRGRFREAVPVAAQAADLAPEQATLRVALARACKHSGQCDRAADLMLSVIAAEGEDPHWLRQAAAMLRQAGRAEEASLLYERNLAARSAFLPDVLAQGLQDLWRGTETARIPESRFEWAWSLAGDRIRKRFEHRGEEWRQAAQWGRLADELLLSWLECRSGRIAEVVALLGDLGPARAHLRALHARGKGVILASAHVGTLYGGAVALFRAGLPHKWVASSPNLPGRDYSGALISSIDQTEEQVARRILAALRQGCLVTIAVDGAMSPAAPRVRFAGRPVTFSPFVARAAWKHRIPSVFAVAVWRKGRIEPLLADLPEPGEGETFEDYARRWQDACLSHLSAILAGEPENLRMSGGIWRHI